MKTFTHESIKKVFGKIYFPDIIQDMLEHEKQCVYPTYSCPFHEDSGYNLVVNDNKYYCFEWEASGDSIEFLMTYKKMTLVDAVEFLADKAGVKLEYFDDPNLKQPLTHKKSTKIEKWNKIEKLLKELLD